MKRHPHADLIHAWAEGAEIEYFFEGNWWLSDILQHPENSDLLIFKRDADQWSGRYIRVPLYARPIDQSSTKGEL